MQVQRVNLLEHLSQSVDIFSMNVRVFVKPLTLSASTSGLFSNF